MSEELEDGIEAVSAPETNQLASLENAITTLPDDVPIENVMQIREEIRFYETEAKRLRLILEGRMIEHIKTHGSIEYGNGIRFIVSHPKTTKCNDVRATIDAIGQASGGDENLYLGCFSSNAIKHGAAKKILPPEQFSKLFTVVVKDKLESGEPAPKRLAKLDDKFLK